MIYRTLVLMHHKPNILHEDDIIKRVDGGMEVTWHSSPSTTTFYPYHRIWEYQEVDSNKIPNRTTVVDEEHYIDDTSLDY